MTAIVIGHRWIGITLNQNGKDATGMVGADLANLINEAALLAVRRNKERLGMAEIEETVERVVAGLEKKTA